MRKLILLFVSAILVAACSKPEEKPGPGGQETSFSIIDNEVSVPAQGGTVGISYSLENPLESVDFEFVYDAGWITSLADSEGEFVAVVAENEQTSGREVTVTVKYGELSDTFVLKQEAAEVPDPTVTFDFGFQIDGADVTMTVIPSDSDAWYYTTIFKKADVEANGGDVAAMAKEAVDYNVQLLMGFGASFEDAMESTLSKGIYSKLWNLVGSTDYVAVAVLANLEGEFLEAAITEEFRTTEVEDSENAIEIVATEVTSNSISFVVTPSNDDQYLFMLSLSKVWDGMSDEEIMALITNGTADVSNNLFTGELAKTYDGLQPNTKYMALAFGYNMGVPTTDLVKLEVTTEN